MGLGQFIYPRYAVHIATGKAVPIARLQAGCLWYPQQGISGQVATGHVLYIAESLLEAMKGALEDRDELDAEVVDVGVELDGVAHLGDGPVEVLLAHEDAGEVAAGRTA